MEDEEPSRSAPHSSAFVPINAPSLIPDNAPSSIPDNAPSLVPDNAPSSVPDNAPSSVPDSAPSSVPSVPDNMSMAGSEPSPPPIPTPDRTLNERLGLLGRIFTGARKEELQQTDQNYLQLKRKVREDEISFEDDAGAEETETKRPKDEASAKENEKANVLI